MTKFKLYEDILSRSWNRYFYDVEANTIEEAVEKVRYEEVDCYDYSGYKKYFREFITNYGR